MKMNAVYTSDYILKKFNRLSNSKKVDVLYEALDNMQQYNGRSKFDCIAMAMGYKTEFGENDKYIKL